MAEDKKSFLLYADIIHTIKKMPEDKAGKLFLTILEYVNDEDPIVKDIVVDLVFEPIKQQLKRDLKKYEGKKQQWSQAGKKSADSKRLKSEIEQERSTELTNVENVETKTTTEQECSTESTVSVNGSVTVNVNDNVNVSSKLLGAVEADKIEKETIRPGPGMILVNKYPSAYMLKAKNFSVPHEELTCEVNKFNDHYIDHEFDNERHIFNFWGNWCNGYLENKSKTKSVTGFNSGKKEINEKPKFNGSKPASAYF